MLSFFVSPESELTKGCAQRRKGKDAVGCVPDAHPGEAPADPPRDLGAAAAHRDDPDGLSHLLAEADWFQGLQKTWRCDKIPRNHSTRDCSN